MNNEINIISINSSPNRNGNTAELIREVLKGAKDSGASVKEIFLPEHNLKFCSGCLKCCVKGKCPLPDDLEEIRKTVYDADGIIFGSPTYAGDYNATMKNLFERLGTYTLFTSSFGGKYFVGVSTANGNAARKTAKKLAGVAKLGIFKRTYITGSLGVAIVSNGITTNIEDNPIAIRKAHKIGIKLVDDIRRRRQYPFQNLFIRLVVKLHLRSFFRSYIVKNKAGREMATYNNLVKRGLI